MIPVRLTGSGGVGVALLIFVIQAVGVDIPPVWLGAFGALAAVMTVSAAIAWKFPPSTYSVNSNLFDSAALMETEIPFERLSREGKNRRLAEARVALQDMYFHHEHADELGIMDAVRTGKSFNAEACWNCGKSRFAWASDE